jgi:uncharacterized OB-fold protein
VNDDVTQIDVHDPTTEPFWAACREHRLIVQKCGACGAHQFYPRPFCLSCEASDLDWVDCSGKGTLYSVTIVRVPVTPELEPPYALAIVELQEGPRLLSNVDDLEARIGDQVELDWRDRGAMPPVPVFKLVR